MVKGDNGPDVEKMQAELYQLKREQVAREVGINPEHLDLVKGDTIDELRTNAAALVKAAPGVRSKRGPQPAEDAAPESGPESVTDEDRAAIRDEDGNVDPAKMAEMIRQKNGG